VWDFDAFLALETRGKYCFQDADAARDFLSLLQVWPEFTDGSRASSPGSYPILYPTARPSGVSRAHATYVRTCARRAASSGRIH
jgi:hypothetical protein